jgi:hypothetical protein
MRTTLYTLLILSAVATASAQGPRGERGPNPDRPFGAINLDLARQQTIEGSVSALSLAYGAQYPSIQINGTVIKVAPVWFLLDAGFELKTGDRLTVNAVPSILPSDSYLYAISISNNASGQSVTLRDSSGIPEWTGGRAVERGAGVRASGACVTPGTAVVSTGTVVQVNADAGIQMPTLLIKTTNGALITVKIGPERLLLENDFEIAAGDSITVKYAVCERTGENVALELTNAAGTTLVLRNEDGTPAW